MKEIVEDLLKLIYAYQSMHKGLGITGKQSPSVLRAENWLAAEQSAHEPAEQKTACAWDNVASPDFDGCNGCDYACALGRIPPRTTGGYGQREVVSRNAVKKREADAKNTRR